MKRFFSRSAYGYLALHETADGARGKAAMDLRYEQDTAAEDGWRAKVEEICWGELREHVVKTKSTPTPDGPFDSIDEFELVDVAQEEPSK